VIIKHPQDFSNIRKNLGDFVPNDQNLGEFHPNIDCPTKIAPFRPRLETINIPLGILMVSGVAGPQKLIIY